MFDHHVSITDLSQPRSHSPRRLGQTHQPSSTSVGVVVPVDEAEETTWETGEFAVFPRWQRAKDMPSRLDTFSTDATISLKEKRREKDAKIMQTKDKLKLTPASRRPQVPNNIHRALVALARELVPTCQRLPTCQHAQPWDGGSDGPCLSEEENAQPPIQPQVRIASRPPAPASLPPSPSPTGK